MWGMASSYNVDAQVTSLVENDLVVWGASNSNLATSTISNDWLTLSTTKADWQIFKVVKDGNAFYLQEITNNKYIYSSAAKKIAWHASNKTAITLGDDHEVLATEIGGYYKNGTSGIRSYTGQGQMEKTYLYKVSSATLSSIAITTQPTKLAYVAGETFSATGAEVTATYSDASSKTVSATWTPTEALSAGLNQTVTASYTENAVNKTATTTINVYSVTVQVVDEDGNTLSGVGMPSASATARDITASAKGNNYVFKTWEFVGSNNGLSFGTATNRTTTLSGTPTGNVTIKAVYHKPIAVTWKVNGKAWTPSAKSGVDGTAEVGYGEQVSQLPTDPTTAEFCGQKFMGWTKTEIGSTGLTDADEISALNLFTTAGNSPSITTETTFHAVFADYAE